MSKGHCIRLECSGPAFLSDGRLQRLKPAVSLLFVSLLSLCLAIFGVIGSLGLWALAFEDISDTQ